MLDKAPDILLKHQLKNIKNTHSHFYYEHLKFEY